MEATNDALKCVVKAKKLLEQPWDEKVADEMYQLLNQAEEALVKAK